MTQDHIWAAYQNDPAFVGSFGRGRHEYLAKRVPTHARVLTVGIGTGTLEAMLVRKQVRVSCLDPDEVSIRRLRQELGLGQEARVGYSQAMPFPDAEFDYVIMSEVLEHLDDATLDKTLVEVGRTLRPGGRFIGTVPADEMLAANVVVCLHCGERFHRWGHLQSFSRESLSERLRRYFAHVTTRRVLFADMDSLNWKGKVSWLLRSTQAVLNIKGSNQSLVFEATKS